MQFFSCFIWCSLVWLNLCVNNASGQTSFQVEIDTASFSNQPGLHSFAFARHNDNWLFIGGWKRGLHGFYPTNAFPNTGRNDSAFVFNESTGQVWKAHLGPLPQNIYHSLTTTNMEYHQSDTVLYVIGGYGWNYATSSHQTYSTITAINVPSFIQSVISSSALVPHVRQTSDSLFTVAGGHLEKIDSTYMLVFGHRFDGFYNLNPGPVQQQYSNQIRKFKIDDDGTTININWVETITDTINFHRRDYNLVPQIFPSGEFGFTAFTGVFQYGIDLPYLNTVDITSTDTTVNSGEVQYLNQYHTAVLPIHDQLNNYMHTCFFGGIALYWVDTTNTMQIDSLVPFVNTISRMTRNPSGIINEYTEQQHMPGFYGTNALFIPKHSVHFEKEKILILDSLSNGKTHVGWIFGGIEADAPNVAFNTTLSRPSKYIWDVYIKKNVVSTEEKAQIPFEFSVFPNPASGIATLKIHSTVDEKIHIELIDCYGKILLDESKKVRENENLILQFQTNKYKPGLYYVNLIGKQFSVTKKLLIVSQ